MIQQFVKYNNPRASKNRHPRIISVAVVGEDGHMYSLPPPNRHHHVIQAMHKSMISPKEEGFLTQDNLFVSREVGLIYALFNRQVRDRKDPFAYNGSELFSEDLW